nr:interferon alpha-inducible protein 27-like protein 2B [Macaca fascicularis]
MVSLGTFEEMFPESTADPSSSSSPQEDVREVWGTLSHGANPKFPLPAAVAVGTVPVELGAVGFTSVGIAASSIAAKMTSTVAIANGGGVAAGSLVATLPSVEAAGLSVTSKVILGSAGTALGAWLGSPLPPPQLNTTLRQGGGSLGGDDSPGPLDDSLPKDKSPTPQILQGSMKNKDAGDLLLVSVLCSCGQDRVHLCCRSAEQGGTQDEGAWDVHDQSQVWPQAFHSFCGPEQVMSAL